MPAGLGQEKGVLRSICSLAADEVSDPALGIGVVAFPPGDQVDVAMEEALPGDEPRVRPNVKALHGFVLDENGLFHDPLS